MPPWSVTWSDGATYTGLTISPHSRQVSPADLHWTSYTVTSLTDANGVGTSTGSATFTLFPPTPAPVITAPASAFSGASGLRASVPFPRREHVRLGGIVGGTLTSNAASDHVTFTASPGGPTYLSVSESGPLPIAPVQRHGRRRNLHVRRSPSTLSPCRVFDTRGRVGGGRGVARSRRVRIPNPRRLRPLLDSTDRHRALGQRHRHAALQPDLDPLRGQRASARLRHHDSFAAGQTRASNAIVRLGSDGSGTLGVQNNSPGSVHFILDVNGYFE